jgi:hypothetical protein
MADRGACSACSELSGARRTSDAVFVVPSTHRAPIDALLRLKAWRLTV